MVSPGPALQAAPLRAAAPETPFCMSANGFPGLRYHARCHAAGAAP